MLPPFISVQTQKPSICPEAEDAENEAKRSPVGSGVFDLLITILSFSALLDKSVLDLFEDCMSPHLPSHYVLWLFNHHSCVSESKARSSSVVIDALLSFVTVGLRDMHTPRSPAVY